MTGTRLELDLDSSGAAAALRTLGSVRAQGLVPVVAQLVEGQTRRRLSEDKRAPDGSAWPAWSEAYSATRKPGQQLLESEGHLIASIDTVVSGGAGAVGSPLVYAAIHQFGGAEVDMAIPERPYLGISPDDRAEIDEVIQEFVESEIRRAGR